MVYYQILKQRRLALSLSIQQVAQQTRLKPEYVRALEEHDLNVFGDQGLPYVPVLVEGYCDALGINWNVIAQEVQDDVQSFMLLHHSKKRALPNPSDNSKESSPTKKAATNSKTKKKKKKATKAKNHSHSTFPSSKLKKTSNKKTQGSNKKLKKKASKKDAQYKKRPFRATKRKPKQKVTWGRQNRLSKLILISACCAIFSLSMLNYFAQNAAQTSLAERKVAREKELLLEEATTQRLADEFKQRKYGLATSQTESIASPSILKPTLTITNTDKLGTYRVSGFTNQSKIEIELLPETAQDMQILWNNHPAFSQKVSGSFIYELNTSQDGTLTIVFSKGSEKNGLRLDDLDISSEFLPIDEKGQTKVQFLIVFQDKDKAS
ncbi:MAG: helix-turn-helix domain-containing protein [Allobaculum sp.]|nr:helix-turn-helix domain-containing protein [Allobaculum sp.]